MSVSDVRRGVTVFWVDRHGDDHVYEYPSAESMHVESDGSLHVLRSPFGRPSDRVAIHAPGRWDSAVKHPETEQGR